jgi:hypothetical protein
MEDIIVARIGLFLNIFIANLKSADYILINFEKFKSPFLYFIPELI